MQPVYQYHPLCFCDLPCIPASLWPQSVLLLIFLFLWRFNVFLYFCIFYKNLYFVSFVNNILVRNLRNATAHSNYLINNLLDKIDDIKEPDSSITSFVLKMSEISSHTIHSLRSSLIHPFRSSSNPTSAMI
jgi:hypothetical protein